MKVSFADRLLTAERRTILSNSSYLMAATIATAGFGFAFWWVAARRFPAHEVGLAAAAVSSMTLLGSLSMLGFGTLLISEIHERRERAMAYVSTATIVSGLAGIGLGIIAILVAPLLSADLATFARDLSAGVLFSLGVGLTSASLVTDQALVGLLRGGTQFARNAIFAGGKLGLLAGVAIMIAGPSSVAIFATWVAGLAASMLLIVLLAIRADSRPRAYRPDVEILRHLGRGILKHHTLNMAVQAPNLALPVIVAAMLSTTETAYFYSAAMMAGFVAIATPAFGITLFAVAARSPALLAHSIRLTLAISFAFSAAGSLAAIVFGRFVLSTFGQAYADEATFALVVLTLATLPAVVKTHFTQLGRIRKRVGWTAVIVVLGAALELTAAAMGAARGGLIGLTLGYAIAVTIEGVILAAPVLRAAELWPGSRGTAALPGELNEASTWSAGQATDRPA